VGGARELMGACIDAGPVSGVISGAICDRSPDVFGVALDPSTCRTTIAWPAVDVRDDPSTASDDQTFAAGSDPGTFVSTQNGGPTLCGTHAGVKPGGGGGGGSGSASSCRDKVPPVSRFARKRSIARRKLHFSGTSHDKGCKGANGLVVAGKISRVLVSVARVRGPVKHQTCAFLTAKGSLTSFRNCRKPVLLRAHGTSKWSITLKANGLPRGNYRVVVRAIDAAKNKERPKGANISRFRVR
jgi:hypothetical protein